MATLTIEQAHALSASDVRQRLEQLLTTLSNKYGGEFRWQGDAEAQLKHSMAKAVVRVEPARVVVTVEGGLALSLVKGKVEARVKQELQRALA